MAESKIKATLKQIVVAGTTDGSSNLRINEMPLTAVPVFATDNYHAFIPFNYGGTWYTRVQQADNNGTPAPNTSISCTVYYL